ncbi:MAG: hypothetical protein AB7U79_01820 [Candidatus Izemoplasmatales bacterium]
MAKQSDIIKVTIDSYESIKRDSDTAIASLNDQLSSLLEEKKQRLTELEKEYEQVEQNHLDRFIQVENDYNILVEEIKRKYIGDFETLDIEYKELTDVIESKSSDEMEKYQSVLSEYQAQKDEAYQRFLSLINESNQMIDDEMKVHTEFIQKEEQKYLSEAFNYQSMQSKQSDDLLWSIEQSKNALLELSSDLREKTSNQVSFMNENVFSTLTSLRQTKHKISALFKSTTDIYSKQKEKIEALSHQRQKPHSLINQTVIRQFVKQIREVNQKKEEFSKLISKELIDSKKIIGGRILEANENNDKNLLEKYILQYEMIESKADYLLKRNQSMADLLISKYQAEIKKIKIDSFKRVEEIRLAYYMPTMFFQNSIILYSNFSFYVNESFDELDNLLSDLILFNQKYLDAKMEYVVGDSKLLEDYKINLMVQINNVCNSLTDYITQIDNYSKEIITLESRNQLEIAEVKKRIENADIEGDYLKFELSLEKDHFFVDHQHESNLKMISLEKQREASLIKIQREIALARQNDALSKVKTAYLKEIAKLEEASHQDAYFKDFAFARTRYEYAKQQNDLTFEISKETAEAVHQRELYLFAKRFETEENVFYASRSRGSSAVISFVHHAQRMIDMNQAESNYIISQIDSLQSPRTYVYYLENTRTRLIEHFNLEFEQKIKINRKALTLIHHQFYRVSKAIQEAFSLSRNDLSKKLLLLVAENADVITSQLVSKDLYLYDRMKMSSLISELLEDLFIDNHQLGQMKQIEKWINVYLEKDIINSKEMLQSMVKKSPKKLVRPVKDYLTLSILQLDELNLNIKNLLDEIEKSMLEKDVAIIENAEMKANKTKNLVNQEYDRLIYLADKQDEMRKLQSAQLVHDTLEIDYVFKTKVKEINSIYEKSVKSEEAKLFFIKENIITLMKEAKKAHQKALRKLEKAYIDEQMDIDLKLREHEKAHDAIIKVLNTTYLSDISYIDSLQKEQAKLLESTMAKLDESAIQIPLQYEMEMKALKLKKDELVETKQLALLDEYTHIEEKKFVSLPNYKSEIEHIKERLPEDYLSLYKKITEAEDTFLNQYLTINQDYQADFDAYIQSKKEKSFSPTYENVFYQPFESFEKISTNMLTKNKQVYDDTLFKVKAAKEQITTEENNFKEKQNRIIND